MAAWLAYLKSRLLLPEPAAPEGKSAADMAKALALRLKRLEAIREAGTKLFERPLLGRDVFVRGDPEPIAEIKRPEWSATLYDLLVGLCAERQRQALARVRFAKRAVWSLAEARDDAGAPGRRERRRLERGSTNISSPMWSSRRCAPRRLPRRFAAALELVREGACEVHQTAAFAPIYLRKRTLANGGDGCGRGAVTRELGIDQSGRKC